MQIFYGFDSLPRFVRPVVTVGSFDGVHCGHRALLERLKSEAAEIGGESIVLTFEPHPRITLGCSEGLKLLATFPEKCFLLQQAAIDHLIVIPFDEAFSRIPPFEFVQDYLIGRIGAVAMIVGYDHRFGRGNEGDRSFLDRQHFALRIVPVSECNVDASKVSSTVIRRLLAQGAIDRAVRLLGHPYPVAGRIEKGTVRPDRMKQLPPAGTYAVRIGDTPFTAEIAADGSIHIHPHLPDGEVLINFQPC